jgi:hypothetical protein
MTAAAGPDTTYDVVTGNVSSLPVGNLSENCLVSNGAAAFLHYPTVPALGTSDYYLVRAVNACESGTFGFTSAGPERLAMVCP